jgi:hypothetical protein
LRRKPVRHLGAGVPLGRGTTYFFRKGGKPATLVSRTFADLLTR